MMDDIEKEYERRIIRADTDEAAELAAGLREYRRFYKDREDEDDDSDRCWDQP